MVEKRSSQPVWCCSATPRSVPRSPWPERRQAGRPCANRKRPQCRARPWCQEGFVRGIRCKMERIEEYTGSISPVVAQYPHQGCERLWSIARGTNSARIGRRERLEGIPKTFPELVDLSEGLDLEQGPDARVL